ncbi:hypothetical protein BP00DRAFT_241461 [Aspergillus indologenus CBS 114.80]|uniref:Uncharacterized protein n=1 Tax=Aspergillus indologenus CBS 114.80 TaxID=1450541 RepID=A0A2V5J5D8_9EURO|nr:hypothetical protein BP00DRAFT_241461 [Aspergillus indologenus CBS 114.80]
MTDPLPAITRHVPYSSNHTCLSTSFSSALGSNVGRSSVSHRYPQFLGVPGTYCMYTNSGVN